jgi:predicted type IV restriction endonuclease
VRVDSQDVTEEFYDVEARIRNKKKEEDRLLQLLDTATGKLEDVLAVERELSRVREEIERVEGRLRVLKDLTSLTTINLSVTEVKDYVPEEAATYATRVRRAFQSSITALVATMQGLSIAAIAAAPWLAVILALAVVLMLFAMAIRRLRPAPALVKVERVEEV